jgi:hypothetical protein
MLEIHPDLIDSELFLTPIGPLQGKLNNQIDKAIQYPTYSSKNEK